MREPVLRFVQTACDALRLDAPLCWVGSPPSLEARQAAKLDALISAPIAEPIDKQYSSDADSQRVATENRQASTPRTVVVCDALEAVWNIEAYVNQLIGDLAPGGVLLVSCEPARAMCESVHDYWRLTPGSLDRLLAPLEAVVVGSLGSEQAPHTLLAVAIKAPVTADRVAGINRLLADFPAKLAKMTTPGESQKAWLRTWRRRLMLPGSRARLKEWREARFWARLPLGRVEPGLAPHAHWRAVTRAPRAL